MFGQRLKLARKKAGLSMQALGDSISPKVSAQAISKYEADKMMPSSSVLLGLSKSLGVSMDFLMGGQVEALDGVEFRKHSGTSARDRAQAEARVIERLEDYLAIEDILELESNEDLFANLRCDSVDSEEAIDRKARELRKKWKLGIDPIPSMTTLLEDKGAADENIVLQNAMGYRLTFRQPPPIEFFSEKFLFFLNSSLGRTAYANWADNDSREVASLPPERFQFFVMTDQIREV